MYYTLTIALFRFLEYIFMRIISYKWAETYNDIYIYLYINLFIYIFM